jgi:hypothetical protein
MDGVSIEVTSDLTIEWEPTFDYDGDQVGYHWNLFTADRESLLLEVPTGSETTLTLTADAVNGLLEANGVGVGESIDLAWNVSASDASGRYPVASFYSFSRQEYDTLYYSVNLVNGRGTSTEGGDDLPREFSLEQNYPNPFNPATTLSFALPQASHVTLAVYNLLGQRVATLVDGARPAGRYTVRFDASHLSSGAYIYRLDAQGTTLTRQMMLIK